jgi:hypothetical protein
MDNDRVPEHGVITVTVVLPDVHPVAEHVTVAVVAVAGAL